MSDLSHPATLHRPAPPGLPADDLLECLGKTLRLRRRPRRPGHRLYLDTFDWRLWRADRVLVQETIGRRSSVVLARRDGHVRRRSPSADPIAATPDSLPPGLRQEVAPLLSVRRLLPQIEVTGEVLAADVLDDEGKTVARLAVWSGETRSEAFGEERSARLAPRLVTTPVRGYPEGVEQLRAALVALQIDSSGDLLDGALATVGRAPGDYSSKLVVELDPGQRAADAVVLLLESLRAVATKNRHGVLADLDSEYLHDLRVAVRRSRSLLRELRDVFESGTVDQLKEGLRWLGEVTGPLRDFDVLALRLDRTSGQLTPGSRTALAPFANRLRDRHRAEHRQLAAALKSARYAALMKSWSAFGGGASPSAQGRQPIVDLAAARIWRSWRRVRKLGHRLLDDAPAEDLHRLRIRCKRLRYLLELFRSLFPERIQRPIRALKGLQEHLGAFNDAEVHRQLLLGEVESLGRTASVPPATLVEIGRWIERLASEQETQRRGFRQVFLEFATPAAERSFERLFRRD